MKYVCANCGAETLKWSGKCISCGEWGTLEEVEEAPAGKQGKVEVGAASYVDITTLESSTILSSVAESRLSSGFKELDRVLGGGFVKGQVVLISGEPGIGKSTLLLQACIKVAKYGRVLYLSVEESLGQIYSRYQRVSSEFKSSDIVKDNILFSDEHITEKIVALIEKERPELCIVDSIQALTSMNITGVPGGVSQIRMNGYLLTQAAKSTGVPVIIVGQITKDGVIAGPKLLEHVVDTVLYLQGDEFNVFRVLRSIKNRYGATSEIGVFEMVGSGLREVGDPSEIFIESHKSAIGTAISATLKGSRVVFTEIQALTADVSSEGVPVRRVANGIKKSRLDMLCAVLSRRGGVYLGNKDVFVNIIGGLKIEDPSIDLAICAAIKSAASDMPIERRVLYVGEVGLTGEIRGCVGWDLIQKESLRLGYDKIFASKNLKASKKTNFQPLDHIKNL